MATWRVSLTLPVLVEVEVEADDVEEAVELAERLADFRNGEEDGPMQLVEAVEEGEES